jgi:hypothetical protein
VSYAFITTTANSMVDCMCGGIDYRAFITPAIPYIMNEIGGRTFAQIQNGAGSMSSLLPGGSSGSPPPPFPRMNFPPISFAFPPMPPMPPGFSFGRRLQSSPVAALPSLSPSMLPASLSNMSATALGLATTYVPLIFSSAGLCGGRERQAACPPRDMRHMLACAPRRDTTHTCFLLRLLRAFAQGARRRWRM